MSSSDVISKTSLASVCWLHRLLFRSGDFTTSPMRFRGEPGGVAVVAGRPLAIGLNRRKTSP
eukprot:4729153-Karenia_brevis.AAC.1